MHRVVVVAVPPVGLFELSIPDVVFRAANVATSADHYDVALCTSQPGLVRTSGPASLAIDNGVSVVSTADTVIVAGTTARSGFEPDLLDALRQAAASGARVASICSGAFVLGAAGLLDHRTVTTHWRMADELATSYPRAAVDVGVLHVEDTGVLTSAGLAAGIDLCIHLVRLDLGASVANATGRLLVAAPARVGGQRPFIEPLTRPEVDDLALTQQWILDHLAEPITLTDLARRSNLTVRTLSRRFKTHTGLSPYRWVLSRRLQAAQECLETTQLSLETIARRVGLGSATSLRSLLVEQTGLTPRQYRSTFRQAPAADPAR